MKKLLLINLIFLSILVGSKGYCQTSEDLNKPPVPQNKKTFGDYLIQLKKDLWRQASSPFNVSGNEYYAVSAGLAVTTAFLLTDQSTYNSIKDMKRDNKLIADISPWITEFGSNYGLATLGLFAGYGFISDDRKALETAYLATEAFVTSGIWVIVLKFLSSRERPSSASIFSRESGGHWSGPFGFFRRQRGQSISSFDSFPSGHTASAFAISTVFADQYSENLIVPVLCYSVATMVGFSRITEDTHWLSDVFVGAILGFTTAKGIIAHNKLLKGEQSITSSKIRLQFYPDRIGETNTLALAISF